MMHGHENRLRHSSNEAAEQGRATGGGGGGAKGGGQGEREPMPHVPDTVPGKRVTGAGARTEGRKASRQTSEVGAVCGQAARTVLCGGRPVMGVPTAIARFRGFGSIRLAAAFVWRQTPASHPPLARVVARGRSIMFPHAHSNHTPLSIGGDAVIRVP